MHAFGSGLGDPRQVHLRYCPEHHCTSLLSSLLKPLALLQETSRPSLERGPCRFSISTSRRRSETRTLFLQDRKHTSSKCDGQIVNHGEGSFLLSWCGSSQRLGPDGWKTAAARLLPRLAAAAPSALAVGHLQLQKFWVATCKMPELGSYLN